MSARTSHFSPPTERRHWMHAVSGVAEICIVIGLSVAAAMIAPQLTGLNMGLALGLGGGEIDLWAASLAIGSFLVIPLVEEGAWRGYVLGRLGEGFSPGAAVLLTTALFAVLHIQYLRGDPAMMLTFAGLMIASLGFGFITLRSGSLLPAILAHAIINTPLTTELHIVRLLLAVVLVVYFRKAIMRELGVWAGLLFRWSSLAVLPAIATVFAIALLALRQPEYLLTLTAVLTAVVILAAVLGRSAWRRALSADNS